MDMEAKTVNSGSGYETTAVASRWLKFSLIQLHLSHEKALHRSKARTTTTLENKKAFFHQEKSSFEPRARNSLRTLAYRRKIASTPTPRSETMTHAPPLLRFEPSQPTEVRAQTKRKRAA